MQVKVPVLIRRYGLEQVVLLSVWLFRHSQHPNTAALFLILEMYHLYIELM
jgi:hypothetical protein